VRFVGILGFIPGATADYDGMTFAGHESTAMLAGATSFLIGGGVVYLVLWIYGLVIDHDSAANFVPLNGADDWLHLILAIGMIGLGVVLRRASATRQTV
jgi:hypothetical protein